MYARQREVPHQVRLGERRDEPAGGGVHVDRDIRATARGDCVERDADLADRLIAAVERRAEHRHHTDRVLITALHGLLSGQMEAIALHRHQTRLDVPVAAELVPTHLHVDAEDQVRPVRRLTEPPSSVPATATSAPAHRASPPRSTQSSSSPSHRHRPKRATGGRSCSRPALELRRLRILILVDHVLIRRLCHQLGGVGRHPSRHERSQVQAGAAVEQQLVRHEVISHPGPSPLLGKLVPGENQNSSSRTIAGALRQRRCRLAILWSKLWNSCGSSFRASRDAARGAVPVVLRSRGGSEAETCELPTMTHGRRGLGRAGGGSPG